MTICFLDNIDSSLISKWGGKGGSLAKLKQAGFNVPDGFVISADVKEVSEAAVLEAFHRLKTNYVAVRSSAVAEDGKVDAWAGQLETYLNTTQETLLMNIKKCGQSVWSQRALAYCTQKGIEPTSVGVIVQKMVESDVSGVAFSVNPMKRDNTILIEAGDGLGEAIVSGRITPDCYEVNKKNLHINSKNIATQNSILTKNGWKDIDNDQQKLSDSQIKELAKTVIQIEQLYHFPVDVEWSFVKNVLYILQARPITSLGDKSVKRQWLPDIKKYELTFKVGGLPFLFADLLCRGFGYLKPLFVIHDGIFLQYFPVEMMKWAEEYGYNVFGSPSGFTKHETDFTAFHHQSFEKLQKILLSPLTKNKVETFFNILYQYFEFYSKTDYQFTNKLYLYAKDNPSIDHSIKEISRFKDIARVWINEVSINDDCLLNQLLKKLSEKFGVDDFSNYKINEIIGLFIHEKPAYLSEREMASVTLFDGNKFHYAFGKEAKNFACYIQKQNLIESHNEIKGNVANRGLTRFVKGTARLIKVDYADLTAVNAVINQMQKDEILIAQFTAPELIHACEKASAIITDLGGMLSHAAIVSRELNIPCIVGTGHASLSFHTGDPLCLDMDTGDVIRLTEN